MAEVRILKATYSAPGIEPLLDPLGGMERFIEKGDRVLFKVNLLSAREPEKAVTTQGKRVETVEGMAQSGELHPLQQVFLEHRAVQCGFCTPGVLMAAKGLLNENPKPSEKEVRSAIAGNLCRCTGYNKYVEAILDAATKLNK